MYEYYERYCQKQYDICSLINTCIEFKCGSRYRCNNSITIAGIWKVLLESTKMDG